MWIHAKPNRVIGVAFHCPKATCGWRLAVFFTNPPDGGPPIEHRVTRERTGDTFETLTLAAGPNTCPCGHWEGAIRDGEVT